MMENYKGEVYEPRRKTGERFEQFVVQTLFERLGFKIDMHVGKTMQYKGENAQGIEIKCDQKIGQTGNLFIETHEKTDPNNPQYVESGIRRCDNSRFYLIGNERCFWVFTKADLLKCDRDGNYDRKENNTKTARGFLLPVKVANKLALRICTPVQFDGQETN